MPVTFAEAIDLTIRYPSLQGNDSERIQALLEDAAAMIISRFRESGKTIDITDAALKQNLKTVSCSMVARVLSNELIAAKTYQQTAGSYSLTQTFETPPGDMYINSSERKMLGLGRSKVSCYDMLGG